MKKLFIDTIIDKIKQWDLNVYSLCEYKEEHYNQIILKEANIKNDVYSISKSITSLVVGNLVEEGILSLQEGSVAEMLGDKCPLRLKEKWQKVNLHNLLTHTTGYQNGSLLDIDTNDLESLGQDYLMKALDEPLVYEPGTKMVYTDANYYLISRIISVKTGRSLYDIARESIFNPLGIYGSSWATCPEGYTMGATGLMLSVMDMTKIGVMMLHDGVWENRQIVPLEWISNMRKRYAEPQENSIDGYGYGFWTRKNVDGFLANGMLGQMIFISPKNDLVLSWQSCTHSDKISKLADYIMEIHG